MAKQEALLHSNGTFYENANGLIGITFDETLENNSWNKIACAIKSRHPVIESWLGQTKTIVGGTYNGNEFRLVDIQPNRYQKSDESGYTQAVFTIKYLPDTLYVMSGTNTNGSYATMPLRQNGMVTIFGNLPTDIKNVITECKIKSGRGSNSTQTTTSNEKVFIPCEYELFGETIYSLGSAEGSPQYDYWVGKSASDRIMRRFNGTDYGYWLRSPYETNGTDFCFVDTSGNENHIGTYTTRGVPITFAI